MAAAAVRALDRGARARVVLAGRTVDGMGYAPAVAAELGLGSASDAVRVDWADGAPLVRRGAYGDRLVAAVEFPGRDRVLVMVRAGAYPAAIEPGAPPVRDVGVRLATTAAATSIWGTARRRPATWTSRRRAS